ncbi:MAG: hypothetical protein ABIO70_05625 [Pseudomonadota bacterium]
MLPYSDPSPARLMIGAMTPFNRLFILPLLLRVQVDLPAEERARFRRWVNMDTAAFLAPSHPMMMIDWMVDKEVSAQVSPLMCHWGDAPIVNANKLAKWYWTRNGLIAASGREAAEGYSVRRAIEGHGVLLHPEGIARWTADRVHEIFPGIARMSIQAVKTLRERGQDRPVYIVPFVSRLRFQRDISGGLHAEMTRIERRLALPEGAGLSVPDRFAALQVNLLKERLELLQHEPAEPVTPASFFSRVEAFSAALRERLVAVNGPQEGTLSQQVNRHGRALGSSGGDGAEHRLHKAAVHELRRLYCLSPDLYGGRTLSQEQIAESLKRILREIVDARLAGNLETRDVLRKVFPRQVGPAVIHVRLADPIRVSERVTPDMDEAALTEQILADTHAAMQRRLDELKREVDAISPGPSHPNPLQISEEAQI